MKKLALSMILGASLMVTSSAFALTSMTDSNMKSATGQAGVSIAVDNVKIETYTGTTKYWDDNGTDRSGTANSAASAAAIVISGRHTVKEFLAMTSDADYQADFQDKAGVAALNQWVPYDSATGEGGAHALTIDVGRCATLSAGLSDNLGAAVVAAGVVIGLPTLMIATSSDTYTVGIEMAGANVVNGSAATNRNTFIRIEKGASVTAILGGTLEIAPH